MISSEVSSASVVSIPLEIDGDGLRENPICCLVRVLVNSVSSSDEMTNAGSPRVVG